MEFKSAILDGQRREHKAEGSLPFADHFTRALSKSEKSLRTVYTALKWTRPNKLRLPNTGALERKQVRTHQLPSWANVKPQRQERETKEERLAEGRRTTERKKGNRSEGDSHMHVQCLTWMEVPSYLLDVIHYNQLMSDRVLSGNETRKNFTIFYSHVLNLTVSVPSHYLSLTKL